MQYFGGKLSAAQLQVAGWVGSFRRSLQGALELVWGPSDEKQEVEEEEDVDDKEEGEGGDEGGRFQRAMSPLRSFARRSRRSLQRFSGRSRQPFQKRASKTCSVNSYSTNEEDEPTETLLHSELPQQDGISEQMSKPDSPTPVPDPVPVPDVSYEDIDNTDCQREPDLAAFPEISTPLLDTSTQRSKAVLSRRRTRSRPSRSLRLGSIKAARVELSGHDGEKENESDSEEESPISKPVSSTPTSTPKVPMFPGLSPAALLAGIKKKTGGVATGAEGGTAEDRGGQENEKIQNKEVAPSPSQVSGSPRLPGHLAGAARVLPPIGSKEGSNVSSPAWLKELKSKKRMSQHNGET